MLPVRTAQKNILAIVVVALLTPATTTTVKPTGGNPNLQEYDYYPDWLNNVNPPCPNGNSIDGCGRTPARTKPPGTAPTPNERTTLAPAGGTTKAPSHYFTCTQEEVKEAACLQGGECFALEILDTRSAHCRCSEMWTGLRCEQIDDKFFVLSADKVEKASIAAGVVAVVIIVTVVIVYLIVKKRKERKERAEANGQANGHAGKALIADKDRGDTAGAEEMKNQSNTSVNLGLTESHTGTTFEDDVEKCTDV